MHRILWPTLAAALLSVGAAQAQYFGQNRVRYRDFEFSIIETEHFDVYYYDDFRDAALDAAQLAERAYATFSRRLNHRYRERQPIILFASHSEFQQNNLTSIGEGVGGVTDPLRHRVMLPFTGAYEDFDHVLQHEIVHQFQFDIFAAGQVGAGLDRLIAVRPPLWLMEGMAEYLSLGPVDPFTAMWLRDAALSGTLPTIDRLTNDPRVFPYRYGHALMSYIGERWGDEAIAEILHAVASSGLESGFQRALRIPLDALSDEWHRDVERVYLAPLAERELPATFARPLLNRENTNGVMNISPTLSPDGSQVAFFSERGAYFIDLYLADVASRRITRRVVRSAFSAEFESLRFLNSAGAWSRDGNFFALPAQHGGRDDLVVFDMNRHRVYRRIEVAVSGITNPTWSPDGTRLAFTGLSEGMSNLFVVDADGTGLRRLTEGRAAALHPSWSPDGRTIAFVTDTGPQSNFAELRAGPLSIALYDVATGGIELLPGMVETNINPQWSPDGTSIAFVSDRTGVANVFLYEIAERRIYQLTNVFSGVSGITNKSPAISWAPDADRLAFTYYENGEFTVYTVDDPRSLKGDPYHTPASTEIIAAPPDPSSTNGAEPQTPPELPRPSLAQLLAQQERRTVSFYRSERGFRLSDDSPRTAPTTTGPVSVRALLDSAAAALPDTSTFGFREYSPKLLVDYLVQPTIGYQRDNFGQGIYGGTAISMSDLLGNRRLILGGQINGRIEEAEVLAVYSNLSRRAAWAVGYQQAPTFFYERADVTSDSVAGTQTLNQRIRRFVIHRAFIETSRPFSRFNRLEAQLNLNSVSNAELNFQTTYDPATGFGIRQNVEKTARGVRNYVQPSLALVYDNSVSLWVGPFAGRRSRFEYAPAFGGWSFHQALADYRRYDELPGPFVFATRMLFFGRFGRDAEQFPVFVGYTELLRGYTSGSFRRRECATQTIIGFDGDCAERAQLIGSRFGVFNAELRFPILNHRLINSLPLAVPPLEGAVFFDAGVAWSGNTRLTLTRRLEDDITAVRAPLVSWGVSVRGNFLGFLILRMDYTKPMSRRQNGAYVTLSLGPTF